jgi:hypothetical protein
MSRKVKRQNNAFLPQNDIAHDLKPSDRLMAEIENRRRPQPLFGQTLKDLEFIAEAADPKVM